MQFLRKISFIFCLFLVACNFEKKFVFSKDWYIIQPSYNSSDSSGYENMALHLAPNGSYTHFAANFYNTGKWKWDETQSKITLIPEEGNHLNGTFVFEVIEKKSTELIVKKIIKKGDVLVRKKNVDTWFGVQNTTSLNPFDASLNEWRIKPSNLETIEQIRSRTFKYLEFLKIYFSYLVENKIENLTHGWYPQPFQMNYVNTARMAYSTELLDWNNCFFNEEQAVEGYKLISGVMYKMKIHNKETIAERNLDLVNQLIDLIK